MKFVTATTRDVRVGDLKPTSVKIVAEKYMREFCVCGQQSPRAWIARDTHKAAKLLQSLQQTRNDQCSPIPPLAYQLLNWTKPPSRASIRHLPEPPRLLFIPRLDLNIPNYHLGSPHAAAPRDRSTTSAPSTVHPQHDHLSLRLPPHFDQPPRRLRHEHHDHELHRRRRSTQPDHPPPRRVPRPERRQQPARDVRHHLAQRDEQHVRRHESAPVRSGADLRDVQRHDEARRADAHADDAPPNHHDGDGAREGLHHGPDDEEDIRVEDDAFPAEGVGEQRREGGDEEGEEGRRGGDDGFIGRREISPGKSAADGHKSRRDDARVI